MSDEIVGRRFLVSGRVQGVYFRGSTATEAERLGVRGRAVNLADGRVEVLAVGPAAAVEELAEWLQRGPRWAQVSGVESRREDPARVGEPVGFTTG